jgi:hypothetical protein
MIGDVIDFSCEQEGMLVQQGVCQELDDLKATYHALPDYLTQVRRERSSPLSTAFLLRQNAIVIGQAMHAQQWHSGAVCLSPGCRVQGLAHTSSSPAFCVPARD